MEKRKEKLVKMRCTSDQFDSWTEKAKTAGVSLSEMLRIALDESRLKQRERIGVDPELIRELARIGNNLNQVAKWANQHKSGIDAVEVVGNLTAIESELSSLRRFIEGKGDAD